LLELFDNFILVRTRRQRVARRFFQHPRPLCQVLRSKILPVTLWMEINDAPHWLYRSDHVAIESVGLNDGLRFSRRLAISIQLIELNLVDAVH
jgi:hypothetical protein